MPRYIVERNFVDGLQIPTDEGAKTCLQVVQNKAEEHITSVVLDPHFSTATAS